MSGREATAMEHGKLLKITADIEALGIRSAGLEAIVGAQSALSEAMQSYERLGVQEAIEPFIQQQDAVRDMLKPLDDVARRYALLADSPVLHELARPAQLLTGLESQHRIPVFTEIDGLTAEFEASSAAKSGALARFAEDDSALQRAMEQMATPWLLAHETMRSVAAFAELQGMGRALESLGTFENELTRALRMGLGDWRDPISWQPELLLDLDRRADFYAGLGFNHDLTALAAPAFAEGLRISGLRRKRPALVALYGGRLRSLTRNKRSLIGRGQPMTGCMVSKRSCAGSSTSA
jgi:hypothetical protein